MFSCSWPAETTLRIKGWWILKKIFLTYFSFNYENVFPCFLTLFFVVTSHFEKEIISMTNSYKVLLFRAELSMVLSSAGGNQYPPLTSPFLEAWAVISPPQKLQGMWQLTQWSSSPSLPSLYCSGTQSLPKHTNMECDHPPKELTRGRNRDWIVPLTATFNPSLTFMGSERGKLRERRGRKGLALNSLSQYTFVSRLESRYLPIFSSTFKNYVRNHQATLEYPFYPRSFLVDYEVSSWKREPSSLSLCHVALVRLAIFYKRCTFWSKLAVFWEAEFKHSCFLI